MRGFLATPRMQDRNGWSMDQERKADTPADNRPNATARKPWHTPRFFATDVIETNTHPTGGGVEPANPLLLS